MSLTDEVVRQRAHRTIIEELISEPGRLGPDFQPIGQLTADGVGPVIGYKATGRGQPGTELGDTLSLLQGAQALGLAERLDWAFRCLAFEQALNARLTSELHITPEPETYGSPVPPRLAGTFIRGRRELRVAAEVHDYCFADRALLARAIAEFRSWGWRIVLADVADIDDAMQQLPAIRPDVVQVDLSRPGGVDTPAVHRFVEMAIEAGASLMALSVHRAADRETALSLGATHARGRLIGSPAPLPTI
jgi:EAL domain-containing protein (putative c-di-GMP-specific phosphodiesterase class I)